MRAIGQSKLRMRIGIVAILLFASAARAQQYLLETGSPSFSTPQPVPLGYINVANGNLHLEISLSSVPQRGGRNVVAKMVYDSRIWKIVDTGYSQSWQPTNVPGTQPGIPSDQLGWRFQTTGGGAVEKDVLANSCYYGGEQYYWYQYQNYRYNDVDNTVRRFPLYFETSNPCHTGATATSSGPSLDATGYKMDWITYPSSPQEVLTADGTKIFPGNPALQSPGKTPTGTTSKRTLPPGM